MLFFAAGIIKTCGSFTDLKKPEHVLKAFIRFALAQGAITYGMELMQALFSIVQGIVTTVMSGSSMAGNRNRGDCRIHIDFEHSAIHCQDHYK